MLDAVGRALAGLGPYGTGLDLCCGTGAGLRVLREAGVGRAVGVDFSGGMLDVARRGEPTADCVRADALALPFGEVFDLVVSFGAFGHFLPREWPRLFSEVCQVLRPGGQFAFPLPAPMGPGSLGYWAMLGFDGAMRVRNAVWRPRSSCTTGRSDSATYGGSWTAPGSMWRSTRCPSSASGRTAARGAGWSWPRADRRGPVGRSGDGRGPAGRSGVRRIAPHARRA